MKLATRRTRPTRARGRTLGPGRRACWPQRPPWGGLCSFYSEQGRSPHRRENGGQDGAAAGVASGDRARQGRPRGRTIPENNT